MTTLQSFLLVTLPVTGMCYCILGALKLALAERLAMNEARVAGLVSAFGFAVGPIILLSGFLADALGRRGVIMGGALMVSASLFILAWSRSYRLTVVAVALLSGGWAAMINVANALMFMAYSKVFVATNLLDFLFGLGAFLTPSVVILLVRKVKFPRAVMALGILPLVPALFAPFVPMEVSGGAAQNATFASLMSDPVMWLCALTLLLWIPTESCTAAWATTFVNNLAPAGEAPERSRKVAAWALSGFWLCFMGSRLLTALFVHSGTAVSVAESMRQARLIHILLAIACSGILLGLILSRSRRLTVALLLAAGFLYGPFFPNLMGILLSHFPVGGHGRAVGVLFAAASVGWTIFPTLIGWRATRTTIQRGFQIALATNVALVVLVVAHYVHAR